MLAFNAKVVTAGNEAMGLWVRAGSWCASQLKGGFVPNVIANAMRSPMANGCDIDALVSAGLWHEVPGGYQFHDWDDYQPSAEQEREKRQKRSDAGKRGADARWGNGKGHADANGNAMANGDATAMPPSRPVLSTTPNGVVGGSRKRGTRLDGAGFVPSEASRDAIRNAFPQLDLRAEHAKFCDYWIAQPGQKGVKLDWDATWRNWMRRAGEQGRTRPISRQQETDDLFAAAMQRAQAADAAHTSRGELTA